MTSSKQQFPEGEGMDITFVQGKKAIVISGKEAVELFYDEERFQRKGAVPKHIIKSLFGIGGMQGLDGEANEHRKAVFSSLMTQERIQLFKDLLDDQWEMAAKDWERKGKVELFAAVEEIMCRTACQWAGIPMWAKELKERTKDLVAMIDAFGAVGPRYWWGKRARSKSEQWISRIVLQVRTGKIFANEDTALYQIAWHRDTEGNLLSTKASAEELINILRPIVAIGRFITFGALALHQHPETRQHFQEDTGDYARMFAQEVHRFYPFGPFLGAKVRHDFAWNGYGFKQGMLVMLDLYGTNHSPDLWHEPESFLPERFKDWEGSPFDFTIHDGRDYGTGHYSAIEWVTIEAMKTSMVFLTRSIHYNVPEQDLSYSRGRMSTVPRGRFMIQNISFK